VIRAVTYFDHSYLAQGLALWRSLERWDETVKLTVLALDQETAAVIATLSDRKVEVISLAELVAADLCLAAVQTGRSRAEFIFALTPCMVRHALRKGSEVDTVVYLDADLFFFSDPTPLWREFAEQSVLIVAHRYPKWNDDAELYGKYNVGILLFRNDANGRECVDWWRDQCLQSTALDAKTGHYGDQKYLDEWPQRFGGVIASKNPGVNVAPWNWSSQDFEWDENVIRVNGVPLIVFHFAQFKRIGDAWFDSGQLEYGIMPLALRSRIYGEYWTALLQSESDIQKVQPMFSITQRGWRLSLGAWHIALLRFFFGQFWFKVGPWWLAGRLGIGRYSGRVMGVYRHWRRRSA
jgi:hypothetical protein